MAGWIGNEVAADVEDLGSILRWDWEGLTVQLRWNAR